MHVAHLLCGFSLAGFRFQNTSCHHVEQVWIALLSSDSICALQTLILISVKPDIIEKGNELLWVQMHIYPKQTQIMSRENSVHYHEEKTFFSETKDGSLRPCSLSCVPLIKSDGLFKPQFP